MKWNTGAVLKTVGVCSTPELDVGWVEFFLKVLDRLRYGVQVCCRQTEYDHLSLLTCTRSVDIYSGVFHLEYF